MKRFFTRLYGRVSQAYTKFFPNTLKKRTWWPVFLIGVFLVAIVGVGIVHAQVDFSLEGLLNGLVEILARILIELSKLCIFLAIFFLRAFITLASYNNYIDVSVVKLGWVMVRDVANMFFIVGLLIIAFATILGFESYEWKKGVVKIVLMAILINFSNLIAQLIIDVAHIFTITFLNAVSATAGGNLITLFQLDNILKLASGSPTAIGDTREVASLTLFAGSALAFIFALLAALSIGAYLIVMIARIVVLWALIILSPLAFMLYALPKGEEYAHSWWSEFSKHVIVAPIMVFFLWLSFATLGTGQIITEIQKDPNVIQLDSSEEKQTVTVLEISTWENFASFLLGIGFLWVGIKKTEETGATGSHLVGNAIDFTKNVATIATGYAAGRWIVGKGVEKGKELGVGTFNRVPIIGGAALKEYGAAIKATYQKKGLAGVTGLTKLSGGRIKAGGYEGEMRRSDQAKKLEEKGGMMRWIAARFIEPAGRAGKRAHDWEEGAERMHEAMEESYSTSGSRAGQAKIAATLTLKEIEHRSEAKAAAKLAERMKENRTAVEQLEKLAAEMAKEEMGHDPALKAKMENYEVRKKKLAEDEQLMRDQAESEWRENEGIDPKAVLNMDQIKKRDEYFKTLKDVEKYKPQVERIAKEKKELKGLKSEFSHIQEHMAEHNIHVIEGNKKLLNGESEEVMQAKAEAEAIKSTKDIKDEKERKKMMEEAKEREISKLRAQSVRGRVIEEMTKGMKGSDKEKEIFKLNKLMDRDGGIMRRIHDGHELHKIHEATIGEKASTEEVNKPIRRATEIAEAEARDEILSAQKLPTRYVAAVNAKHQKEDEEERSGLNYKEITSQAGGIAKKVSEQFKKGIEDPALIKALGTTLSVSLKRGAETGMDALKSALESIGFKEKINASDMEGQQRRVLSALLGRVISEDDVRKRGGVNNIYEEDFVSLHGKDTANALMKEIDAGIKASVKEGGVNTAGILDDSQIDEHGRIAFKFRDKDTQRGDFLAGRKYWSQEVDLPKLLGLGDVINNGKDGITLRVISADGTTGEGLDEQALDQMATVFASFKANTRLHNRAVDDLKALYKKDEKGFTEVIKRLGGPDSVPGKALLNQAKGISLSDSPPAGGGAPAGEEEDGT